VGVGRAGDGVWGEGFAADGEGVERVEARGFAQETVESGRLGQVKGGAVGSSWRAF